MLKLLRQLPPSTSKASHFNPSLLFPGSRSYLVKLNTCLSPVRPRCLSQVPPQDSLSYSEDWQYEQQKRRREEEQHEWARRNNRIVESEWNLHRLQFLFTLLLGVVGYTQYTENRRVMLIKEYERIAFNHKQEVDAAVEALASIPPVLACSGPENNSSSLIWPLGRSKAKSKRTKECVTLLQQIYGDIGYSLPDSKDVLVESVVSWALAEQQYIVSSQSMQNPRCQQFFRVVQAHKRILREFEDVYQLSLLLPWRIPFPFWSTYDVDRLFKGTSRNLNLLLHVVLPITAVLIETNREKKDSTMQEDLSLDTVECLQFFIKQYSDTLRHQPYLLPAPSCASSPKELTPHPVSPHPSQSPCSPSGTSKPVSDLE